MGQSSSARVKKVKPFPFSAELNWGGKQVTMQILNLNTRGAIVDLKQNFIKIGDECQCTFELPVLHSNIQIYAKAVKTYDQFLPKADSNGNRIQRLCELQFLNLSSGFKFELERFLSLIG
ncbi:MAG: hypothetical protein K1X29_06480 [Bdellovibrionales bacterium]|nr:hypothetical protein [Bdellovibrionales bacterium]